MPEAGTCRSCKGPILWARTVHGNVMPLDFEPNPNGLLVVIDGQVMGVEKGDLFEPIIEADRPRYVPHVATCPIFQARRTEEKKGQFKGGK